MADNAKIRWNKQRKRWCIVVKWQGKRHYCSVYMGIPTGNNKEIPCEIANRIKTAIDTEIDKGIFNPARYKKKKPLHLKQYVPKWLEEVEGDLSTATYYDYKNSLKNHIIPILGDKFLADIGYADIKELQKKINRMPSGKKNVLDCFKKMLKDAKRAGHINVMPEWIVWKGKNSIILPPIKYISISDQWQILEKIPIHHRPIFMFMMATGCRPSEARAFRRVDICDDYIMFEVAFGRKGELKEVKQKKSEPWPMTEEVRQILAEIPKNLSPYVFLNPTTKKPYSKNINRIWNKACEDSKVQKIDLYKATRHSFACGLLNAGADKGTVSRLLRHSDPRMIERYAKYQLEPLKKAVDNVRIFPKLTGKKSENKS